MHTNGSLYYQCSQGQNQDNRYIPHRVTMSGAGPHAAQSASFSPWIPHERGQLLPHRREEERCQMSLMMLVPD